MLQQYSSALSSPAVRRLGNRGLFFRLAGRRIRYQVAAHAGPCAVVDVQVAVLHLLGDIANALREPFPILTRKLSYRQARRGYGYGMVDDSFGVECR